ncbi:MAG: VWA domain-containing protein [Clostridiales bacterium]|nr:VWA domain-containing protein [Clostridiales bacterium]
MALKGQVPEKSKEAARGLVRAVVDEIMERLEQDLRRAVTGALNKKAHSVTPNLQGTDWKRTINKNLKNYDYKSKRILPEKFYFFERRRKSKEWAIILDIDQSGSMADSIIYSSVMGAVFASMPALDTHVVVFDTEVVDLTEVVRNDPVDMLFGIQLGGGTDINKSVRYCSQFIENPQKTIFILISDLFEGGVEAGLLRQLAAMKESGVKCMSILALSDRGKPSYDEQLGRKIANLGIPSFACSPDKLPELVESAIKGYDMLSLSEKIGR